MLVCLLAPILACATLAQEPPSEFVEQPGHLELSGRMIARPVQNNELARDQALAQIEGLIVLNYPEVDEWIVLVPEGEDENSFAAQLITTRNWEYVHPDWICYPLLIPDDTNFGSQWHHQMIESEAAWEVIHSAPDRIAAWTDTGVDTDHPDLMNQLLPGYNAVDHLTEAQGGEIEDINGHGTLTGGTIGATGNNGIGVAGAVWDIQLLPIRVSNSASGGAYLSDLEHGARWAVENGAKTISASYSGVEYSSVQTTGAYVRSLGGLYFYAADNNDTNHSSFDWDDVVVVGASDFTDGKAWFSSYGVAVDMTAPGVDIWSTEMGGGYRGASGTSLSTPLANGVASLLWAANPYLTTYEVEQSLYAACDDLGDAGEDDVFGHGRANMKNAVFEALEGDLIILTPNLLAGKYANITLNGAQPSTVVFLGYSITGTSVVNISRLKTTIGLDQPQAAGQVLTDANGSAMFHKFLPLETMGITVWIQAACVGDTSNIDARVIQ
ncbi:MAG: S8 family serine peptidase [Planctomycetes bacterium]|nr:S8 family serine peptidase [Planctomycetota bacterium]